MKFSLQKLFVLITAAAVTCFGLVYANPLFADLYYTACVAAISGGVVAAVARQGERRAYWIGFVVVAGAYFGQTVFVSQTSMNQYFGLLKNVRFDTSLYNRPQLITTRALVAFYESMEDAPVFGQNYNASAYTGRFTALMVTGHCSFALFFGWVAGCLGRRLFRARGRNQVSD
jgi:hypothetical protein